MFGPRLAARMPEMKKSRVHSDLDFSKNQDPPQNPTKRIIFKRVPGKDGKKGRAFFHAPCWPQTGTAGD
jgi:hypothetical protein